MSTAQAWKSKYKAQPVEHDGIRFASKKEGKRYLELKLLERAGQITRLELQPRFDLIINGKNCGFYKADFRYFQNGKRITEDCKGMRTPLYALKSKIVSALYNVEILET
jgi:hypothetical protein